MRAARRSAKCCNRSSLKLSKSSIRAAEFANSSSALFALLQVLRDFFLPLRTGLIGSVPPQRPLGRMTGRRFDRNRIGAVDRYAGGTLGTIFRLHRL